MELAENRDHQRLISARVTIIACENKTRRTLGAKFARSQGDLVVFVRDPHSCVDEIESNICVSRVFFEPSIRWSPMVSLLSSEFPHIQAYWMPRGGPDWKPTPIHSPTKIGRAPNEKEGRSLKAKTKKRRKGTLARARRFEDERHLSWQRSTEIFEDDWSPYESFYSSKFRKKRMSRIQGKPIS